MRKDERQPGKSTSLRENGRKVDEILPISIAESIVAKREKKMLQRKRNLSLMREMRRVWKRNRPTFLHLHHKSGSFWLPPPFPTTPLFNLTPFSLSLVKYAEKNRNGVSVKQRAVVQKKIRKDEKWCSAESDLETKKKFLSSPLSPQKVDFLWKK